MMNLADLSKNEIDSEEKILTVRKNNIFCCVNVPMLLNPLVKLDRSDWGLSWRTQEIMTLNLKNLHLSLKNVVNLVENQDNLMEAARISEFGNEVEHSGFNKTSAFTFQRYMWIIYCNLGINKILIHPRMIVDRICEVCQSTTPGFQARIYGSSNKFISGWLDLKMVVFSLDR